VAIADPSTLVLPLAREPFTVMADALRLDDTA